jgi:hypothetical protein
VHERQRDEDRQRQEALEREGYRFVRLTDEQVMTDLPSALATIRRALMVRFSPPPSLPPRGGGAGGGGPSGHAPAPADRINPAEPIPPRDGIFDDPALRWMLRQQKQEVAR